MGWIEGRRRWVWLSGLVFVALLLTPVGVSGAVPVSSGDDVLIIAAHPDDDVITAAGIIEDQLDVGGTVTVAYVTNGDRCESQSQVDNGRCSELQPGIGTVRQGEAVDAERELGTVVGSDESNLIFMGYPNGFVDAVRYGWALPELFHDETYASRGLGGTDWHDHRTGDHAAYTAQNLLDDMEAVIEARKPDHIFTHMRWDRHEDHRGTYYVVIDAVENVQDGDPSYNPYIHTALVHVKDPAQWGQWPASSNPTTPVNEYSELGEDTNDELVWDQRESFEVPPEMQLPYYSGSNPKAEAIEEHSSQLADGFIRRFAHSDEVFWVEKLGAAEGRDDNHSLDEGGSIAVSASGLLRNDVRGIGMPFGVAPGIDPTPLGPMSAVKVTNPSHGSVTVGSDGSFTYTHDGSEAATDSFTYRPVQGSTNGSVATVTINVNPINDPPSAVADGPYTVANGGTSDLPVLGNDTDPENDPLTAIADAGPQHGTLLPKSSGFAYTHDGSATTSDSFTYHVRDTGGLTSGPVTVSIDIIEEVPDPLSVTMSGPAFGSPGTTATYTAAASGGSGSATISWSVMRSGVEVDSGEGTTFDFEPDLAGAHTVMATAEDGSDTDSDSLGLTVMEDIVGNVFAADILWLADEGITFGCNPPVNDQFCPKALVTRGQMAAFLVRFLGLTASDDAINFTDTVGNIFAGDIRKLATAGITRGCNPPANTEFCPNSSVTRGQMAAFLVRALGLTDDGGGNLFTDDNGSIFESDIDRLATAGVTKGCNAEGTHFCPSGSVTREQMAAFLHRAADLLPGR